MYFQAFSVLLASKNLQLMQILASLCHNSTFISFQSHTNVLSKPCEYAGPDLTSFFDLEVKSLKSIPKRWVPAVDILNLSANEGIYIFSLCCTFKTTQRHLKLKPEIGCHEFRQRRKMNKLFHFVWSLWHFYKLDAENKEKPLKSALWMETVAVSIDLLIFTGNGVHNIRIVFVKSRSWFI